MLFLYSLCISRWGKVTAYETDYPFRHSYKQLYMLLDDAMLSFAIDPHQVYYTIHGPLLTPDYLGHLLFSEGGCARRISSGYCRVYQQHTLSELAIIREAS